MGGQSGGVGLVGGAAGGADLRAAGRFPLLAVTWRSISQTWLTSGNGRSGGAGDPGVSVVEVVASDRGSASGRS